MNDTFTTQQAIEYTGLSRSTLYRKVKNGDLKIIKNGKFSSFKKQDLDDFINKYSDFTDTNGFYTLDDICKIEKCSKRTLFRRIGAGKLKATKVGKEFRVKKSDYK